MPDAGLRIFVDSTTVPEATEELDELTAASGRAEAGAEQLSRRSKTGAAALRQQADATRQLHAGQTRANRSTAALANSVKELSSGASSRKIADLGINVAGLGASAGTAVLGITGIVAAIGILAKATLDGQRESAAFNLAIETTGNRAGATTGMLEDLAEAARKSSGISSSAARAIVTQLVQGGRLGIRTIENLTGAVATFAAVSGKSTDQAGGALAKLFEDPVKAAEELNQQFHFLTASQFQYIAALQKAGKTEQAQEVLSRQFAGFIDGRYRESLGTLERAWKSVGSAIGEAWDALKGIGRDTSVETQIRRLEIAIATLQASPTTRAGVASGAAGFIGQQIEAARIQLAELQRLRDEERRSAAQDAKAAVDSERKIGLAKFIADLTEGLRTNSEKYREERKKLVDSLTAGVIKDQAEFDKLDAALQKKFADRGAARVDSAFEQKKLQLTEHLARAQQELANVQEGEAKSTDRQAAALEAWLATGKNAQQFNAEQLVALRSLALAGDEVAKGLDAATKLQKAKDRADVGLLKVNEDILEATGQSADAAVEKIKREYRQLIEDLKLIGNQAEGILQVEKLIDLTAVGAQLTKLEDEVTRVFSAQSRAEQAIDLRIQSGLISEIEGRRQVVALHQATAAEVDALLPKMAELAAITGDPAALERLKALRAEVAGLKTSVDELTVATRAGFETAFASALERAATGTASLRDIVLGFVQDMSQALARFAAEQLAAAAAAKIFGGAAGGGAGAQQAQAVQQAAGTLAAAGIVVSGSAQATQTAAGDLTAAGVTVTGAALLMRQAAQELTKAAAAAATASAIQLGASGFDEGGFTGHGGKYTPAGIVHRGEFVARREVVKQPGALAFLHDFNRYGMSAVNGLLRGYAEGGLVVATDAPIAPPAPRAIRPPSPAAPGESRLRGSVLIGLTDGLEGRVLDNNQADEIMIRRMSRNPARFRAALSV